MAWVAAHRAALVWAALTLIRGWIAAGAPIGAYDLLIAGQARRRGLTLVTANVSEFGRVSGLAWEDWASGG